MAAALTNATFKTQSGNINFFNAFALVPKYHSMKRSGCPRRWINKIVSCVDMGLDAAQYPALTTLKLEGPARRWWDERAANTNAAIMAENYDARADAFVIAMRGPGFFDRSLEGLFNIKKRKNESFTAFGERFAQREDACDDADVPATPAMKVKFYLAALPERLRRRIQTQRPRTVADAQEMIQAYCLAYGIESDEDLSDAGQDSGEDDEAKPSPDKKIKRATQDDSAGAGSNISRVSQELQELKDVVLGLAKVVQDVNSPLRPRARMSAVNEVYADRTADCNALAPIPVAAPSPTLAQQMGAMSAAITQLANNQVKPEPGYNSPMKSEPFARSCRICRGPHMLYQCPQRPVTPSGPCSCGAFHWRDECTVNSAPAGLCFNCNGAGHFAAACPQAGRGRGPGRGGGRGFGGGRGRFGGGYAPVAYSQEPSKNE